MATSKAKIMGGDRLVLALDSFQKPTSGLRNAMKTMTTISRALGLKVQPVSVVSPDQLKWPREFAPAWQQEFQKLGRVALDETLKKLKFEPDVKPEVLMQFTHSLRASAKTVVKHASDTGAGALGVVTHIRKKSAVAFPGGFIESVAASSHVPVIAVHAEAPAITRVRTILVPTDFSEGAERVFDLALSAAKALSAKVVLFHSMPSPMDPHWFAGASLAGGWERVEAMLEDEETQFRETAQAWMQKAAKQGVSCEFSFVHSPASISDAVLRASKKVKADLIVMAAQTGLVMSFFLGSVMRDVLRRSLTPVIIVRD